MFKRIIAKISEIVASILLPILKEEMKKEAVRIYHEEGDKILDKFEEEAKKTKTKLDDNIIAMIRKASGIPDND